MAIEQEKGSNLPLWFFAGCFGLSLISVCLLACIASGTLVLTQKADFRQLSDLQSDLFESWDIAGDQIATAPSPTPIGVDQSTVENPQNSADEEISRADEALQTPAEDPTVDRRKARLSPPEEIDRRPLADNSDDSLMALLFAHYPPRDYFESAMRLGNRELSYRTIDRTPFLIGDTHSFWTDQGTIQATLAAASEYAYFWFDTRLGVSSSQVQQIADHFDLELYPKITELWGEEWQPGIDNDERFSILHLAEFSNADELGYFDGGDEYPKTINSTSNEQEIVYLNLDSLQLGSDIYYATLSHEVQHLIQWNSDSNELAWLNEGLSQLNELYLGFNTVDTAQDYLANPDTQLNYWDYDDEDNLYAHYGAAYLFSVYIWEQLGIQAIAELAQSQANGIASVYHLLKKYAPDIDLSQFMGNWSVANYLDKYELSEPYFYRSLKLEYPATSLEIKSAPSENVSQINQFSVNYINLDLEGDYFLSFVGDLGNELIDHAPYSGQGMWFASASDDLDAQLTQAFDLTSVQSAHLEFWAWFDLEDEYDFGYVSVSTDGGSSWELLVPNHSSIGEFGPAFSGSSSQNTDNSGGWIFESIPLNRYLGGEVQIRFELLTDSAVTGTGLALDNISIPELGYFDDIETTSDAWLASGFVQSGWQIPQNWSLNLIVKDPDVSVTSLDLDNSNSGYWNIKLGRQGGILVVSAHTPFSTSEANYWLAIEPANN